MSLGGKERLSILQTATPIQPDDLVDKLKADSNWITTIYKAIEHYPDNMTLWEKYFTLWDNENVNGIAHDESMMFYELNRAEMDKGAVVFNDKRFSDKDGHISGIQKLLETEHTIGKNAFACEY